MRRLLFLITKQEPKIR